ncbi:carbohydrate ABC transporter permease [Gorillibacterium sp. sgz5001074]|uniref:carbohydrate ABC transporter permease n=1 Tax=Gorillibacterium sp. sgz5001074 TaxID=3446695 RepID=UPI003F675443
MIRSKSDRVFDAINVLVLGLFALITFFPIYYVFVVSFTEPTEFLTKSFIIFPEHWSLASYKYLLGTKSFIRSLGNSAFLATVGTALSLATTAALAYAISRKRLPGRKIFSIMILITILFSPGIIPNYLLVRNFHLINNVWSLILPALASGWNVILMRSFFDSIPAELEESASIDGCNDISTFFRIILPLSLPSLATFGLFYAVTYYNSYFTAMLYLNDAAKWPIQVLLQNMLLNAQSSDLAQDAFVAPPPAETLKMAAVVVATLPILCVYPFLQKHFAKGAMVGSVKG